MKNKSKKGFTLLVAIVTTTMLFIVSFAVVNIALKLLILTYSNQESQFAFYNAESGMECAISHRRPGAGVGAGRGGAATMGLDR